jgi:hypothetical protein
MADKDKLAEMLKEMFEDGTISISLDTERNSWGKELILKIIIQDKVVYCESETIEYTD